MPHTVPDWLTIKDWCVVVADGTRARFLALEPAATPEMESSPTLSEVKDLINPDFAASDEDVLRDINAGVERAGGGGPTHVTDDHREDRRDENERRFAKKVAAEASSLVRQRQASRLVVAAQKRMLGFLSPELVRTLKDSVELHEIAKDVTKLNNLELHQYLAEKQLLPARRPPQMRPGDTTPGDLGDLPMPSNTEHTRSDGTDSERAQGLRQMLLKHRQEVQKDIDDLLADRRSAQQEQREDSVPDAGDMSIQDFNGDQQLAILEVRNAMRQQLDEALQHLDQGTYGICEDCGQPINAQRLKVHPFARRCVVCQNKAEALERIEREPDQSHI